MEEIGDLPPRGRIFVDSAPIIYYLEDHPAFGPRFTGLFDRAEAGDHQLVISTVTLAEVLTGPLRQGNEQLADDYRQALTTTPTWQVADLTIAIAHRAARIRAPDQAAPARRRASRYGSGYVLHRPCQL